MKTAELLKDPLHIYIYKGNLAKTKFSKINNSLEALYHDDTKMRTLNIVWVTVREAVDIRWHVSVPTT